MQISVVIPTYRRPDMLRQAVAALFEGTRIPDEIIIVGRRSDYETVAATADLQSIYVEKLRSVWVTVSGHIPPVEAGIRAALGDIIAIIDDDVTVTPLWLAHLLNNFYDDGIGIVGGRTLVPGYSMPIIKGKPGKITWYGKLWGHISHVDGLSAFEVDTVKECNWAWRKEITTVLIFDPVLNFDSATTYGIDLTLQVKRRGLKVIYDPQAIVYHHVAPRILELDRDDQARRLFAFCRNYTYVMLKHLSWWRKIGFCFWWFIVGGRQPLGIATLILGIPFHGLSEWHRFVIALAGRAEGVRLWLHSCSDQDKQHL